MGNSSRLRQFVATIAFVCVAALLGYIGRLGLDWLIESFPERGALIERVGGWVIGMAIGIVILLPMLRMYGVFSCGNSLPPAKRREGCRGNGRS
ncbi:MAG: hypothetical protein RL722_2789 [Pseudomonadota bacterium]|jgi:hypothetical protein